MSLSCRFYRDLRPSLDDNVMILVKNITEVGAYVQLLEYDNLEGMILMSELSRRRIRSVNKIIRVGKTEAVLVVRVDREKNFIDLSKKRMTPEEIKKCEDRYLRAKTVYQIILNMAKAIGINTKPELEDLMDKTAWHFDEKFKSVGGSYEGFKRVVLDQSLLQEFNLSEEHRQVLLNCIMHRLEPKKAKIRADVEVACYTSEGIEAVKASLMAGIHYGDTVDIPICIKLIAPPIYMITLSIYDRDMGMKVMHEVIELIESTIVSKNGRFNLKIAPKILTDQDEQELSDQLNNLELQNEEVDGDDDTTDDEDRDDNSTDEYGND